MPLRVIASSSPDCMTNGNSVTDAIHRVSHLAHELLRGGDTVAGSFHHGAAYDHSIRDPGDVRCLRWGGHTEADANRQRGGSAQPGDRLGQLLWQLGSGTRNPEPADEVHET